MSISLKRQGLRIKPVYSANDVLALEIAAGGTQFSAQQSSPESQKAFESLLDADLWMIYRNVRTDVLHFDFVSDCTEPSESVLKNYNTECIESLHQFPCGG